MTATPPVDRQPLYSPSAPPASLPYTLAADHRAFLSSRYFPLLDGLRCLSIVAVVWYHAVGSTYTTGILSHGKEGVSLFFVISGFLITTILLREQSSTGEISLKRFYLRRALRIFPLYYAILLVYVVLVFLTEKQSTFGEEFWHNLPYFLTYTSNWFVPLDSGRIIFFFAWSLATEEQFYLFWPWFVRASARPLLPLATMFILLVIYYGAAFAAANGVLAHTWLFTRILLSLSPPICLGAIAAFLMHRSTTFGWIKRWIGWRWSATAALVTTLAVLPFYAMLDWLLYDWVLYVVMTWLVVACAVRPDHQPLSLLLTNPFVKHVGVVSYGVYLMHQLSINLLRHLVHTNNGPIVFVLALAISISVATFSYRYFESPFLRLKDRVAKRPGSMPRDVTLSKGHEDSVRTAAGVTIEAETIESIPKPKTVS